MTEPTTVYLVTSGEYSDYGINAAFSTEAKAQAYIDYWTPLREYWHPEIEPYTLDEDMPPDLNKFPWRIEYNDGKWTAQKIGRGFNGEPHGWRGRWVVNVWATTEEAALKIGMEKIMQARALNLGLTPDQLHMDAETNPRTRPPRDETLEADS